jgi:hypothetical protein
MKVKLLKPRDIFAEGAVLDVDPPIGNLLIENGAAKAVHPAKTVKKAKKKKAS